MSYRVNDLLIGKVTNVKPYAAFFVFDDGSQGLLHISEINDGFIRDIEKYVSKDDYVKVKILSIDNVNGFMRVSLKQVPEEEFYSTHNNSLRSAPKIREDDFAVLEERLPQWIERTLKKAKEENDD